MDNIVDNLISAKRLHPILYILITNHYASYKEIKEDYDIYDILDLYEAYLVHAYNQNEITKRR